MESLNCDTLSSVIKYSNVKIDSIVHSPHIKCQSDDKTCGQCQMTGLSPLLLWFVLFIIGELTDACVESPNRWSQSAGVGQGREGAGSRSLPSSTSQHTDHARQSVVRKTPLH